MKIRNTLAVLLSFAMLAVPQQVGQNVQPGAAGAVTFSTAAQLVIETVAVKDKNGNPVEGLTAKDFTVTEDNIPQTIKFFEFQ